MRIADWNVEKFNPSLIGEAMTSLEQGAESVASLARSFCPVSKSPRGDKGALRKTIRVVKRRDRLNVRVYAGSKRYFYAPFVELGSIKIGAHHFMLRGLNGAINQIKSITGAR